MVVNDLTCGSGSDVVIRFLLTICAPGSEIPRWTKEDDRSSSKQKEGIGDHPNMKGAKAMSWYFEVKAFPKEAYLPSRERFLALISDHLKDHIVALGNEVLGQDRCL